MNIGIVTTWFERGAAYVSRAYKQVLETEHNVYIYARGGEEYAIGNPEWDDEKVTWGKKTKIPQPMAMDLKDFKKWLLEKKIEIVIFNEQQWWIPVLLCNKMKIIVGGYIDYYKEETIPLFMCYDFLLCNTKRHTDVFKWHPNNIYIPWGTNLELYKPKQTMNVEKNYVTFFHSSGYSPERKGTDLLIHAFEKVKGNSKLIIHAQVSLEEKIPYMMDKINKLVKEKRLEVIHQTVGAPGLYHLGDVYVYPSRLDGIGLTVAEALATGLPAIVSDNPPMNEFITPISGETVKIKSFKKRKDNYYWPMCEVDIQELTSVLQKYTNEADKIEAKKIAARKYAEEYLDWNKNCQVLLEQIKGIQIYDNAERQKAIEMAKAYEKSRKSNYEKYKIIYTIKRAIFNRKK